MKKVQKVLISALCVALGAGALIACGGDNNDNKGDGKVTVTFYNGNSVISTVKVDKNSLVTMPETAPTKDGYEFVRWCATPTFSQAFDFSQEIESNTSVYAGFRSTVDDNHTWYLAGQSKSDLFSESGDFKEFKGDTATKLPASVTMTKDDTQGNKFTFTTDFYVADKFQILNTDEGWAGQIGYGYMNPVQYSVETTSPMYSGGGLDPSSVKKSDIQIGQDGNYTITLVVDADGKMTEISYERNGNVTQEINGITNYYIKGEQITGWGDLYNDSTKMSKKGDVYTLEVYLKANDQVMFISNITEDGQIKPSTATIKADVLTEASKTYVEDKNGNILAKAAGTYTFTYDDEAKTLSVAFDAEKAPKQYDYYIDGTFDGGTWGDYQKAAEDYQLTGENGVFVFENVALAAGEEFVIRAYDKGTEELTWNNIAMAYNYNYLKDGGTAFAAANPADSNYNIKVVTSGNYDIIFDSYAHMITVKTHNEGPDVYDIYLKGLKLTNSAQTESTWDHGFAAEWKMTINADNTAYEITVTAEQGAGFGLARYDKGATTGNGDFLNSSVMGTDGDANTVFTPATAGNFTCSTTGTYKIVYTIATGKVDFYAVTAE